MITGGRWRAVLAGTLVLLAAAAGCQTQAPQAPAVASQALPADAEGPLGRLAAEALRGEAADHSALHLLASGEDALDARLMLVAQARRSIDLQVYIFRPDSSGQALAAALRQAAARGVRVRLLLDAWGTRPDDAMLKALAADPHFEVRLFNPLLLPSTPVLSLLLDFERAQRRMHNKLMVVDGVAAIVGGRNIGDEYFARRHEFAFADVDLLAFGPVVAQLAAGFDPYWNDAAARAVPAPRGAAPDSWPADPVAAPDTSLRRFAERLGTGPLRRFVGRATAVQDPPAKADPAQPPAPGTLGQEIARVMGVPRSELLIVSPYFVPGSGGVAQLRALAEAGVRVTAVTNSLAATDVPAVHAGYARYRAAMLRSGIALHEIRADAAARRPARQRTGSSRVSLHAKVMVADRARTFVGSMNIDPRSLRLNTENGIVVESAELADALVGGVQQDLPTDAWRLHLEGSSLVWIGRHDLLQDVQVDEPQAALLLRLQVRVLSWLPIEALL